MDLSFIFQALSNILFVSAFFHLGKRPDSVSTEAGADLSRLYSSVHSNQRTAAEYTSRIKAKLPSNTVAVLQLKKQTNSIYSDRQCTCSVPCRPLQCKCTAAHFQGYQEIILATLTEKLCQFAFWLGEGRCVWARPGCHDDEDSIFYTVCGLDLPARLPERLSEFEQKSANLHPRFLLFWPLSFSSSHSSQPHALLGSLALLAIFPQISAPSFPLFCLLFRSEMPHLVPLLWRWETWRTPETVTCDCRLKVQEKG